MGPQRKRPRCSQERLALGGPLLGGPRKPLGCGCWPAPRECYRPARLPLAAGLPADGPSGRGVFQPFAAPPEGRGHFVARGGPKEFPIPGSKAKGQGVNGGRATKGKQASGTLV